MQIYNEAGEFQAFSGVHVVKMRKQKGELIPKHSHPKENIVFNAISWQGQDDYWPRRLPCRKWHEPNF